MSASRLSSRYAKSILDLATERGVLDEVLRDVRRIDQTISGSRDLDLMLKSPIIHQDKKLETLKILFADRTHFILMEFMEILVRKRREGFLGLICRSFIEQHNERAGISSVKITTAVPIPKSCRHASPKACGRRTSPMSNWKWRSTRNWSAATSCNTTTDSTMRASPRTLESCARSSKRTPT